MYRVKPLKENEASVWSGDQGWRFTTATVDRLVIILLPEDLYYCWNPSVKSSFVSLDGRLSQYTCYPLDSFNFQQYTNSWFLYMGYSDKLYDALYRRFNSGYFHGIEYANPLVRFDTFYEMQLNVT